MRDAGVRSSESHARCGDGNALCSDGGVQDVGITNGAAERPLPCETAFSGGRQTIRILIVVLVLNLLFWMVVILWRVYILKRARDQIRRQRRQAAEAFSNPSLVTCEGTGGLPGSTSRGERPFVFATPRNELPPPYDEAIKYPSLDWTNSGCELPTLRTTVPDSGGGGTEPAQLAPQQQQQSSDPSRPPVPPRPSRPPSARARAQADSSAMSDAATLPTYEELQRRGTVPNPEIVLSVGSHVRNQSA
ncbi:uncharacterized protein LOC119393812 isoform X2 [Rhipicephalus sanguineus]|uniref:Uncharacterized protein n=1 Tax=Rhipicephalus sanguineus TaxID=34632 RepID=A0A9D4SWW2_RHISA|nr:uncharacterized protein LOC119393812 isoform X2 [Rhipicephalus sanguineus]KAH7952462.1 hypothetical protein HPB52_023619 [Rhipicephalus sanguineus]